LISMINKRSVCSGIIIFCICVVFFPSQSWAETAKSKYLKADAAYRKLRHDPKKQKYRHNWMTCIKKYDAVYQHDPSGVWAAAGLYKKGILYYELFRWSSIGADKDAALANFNRIINEYPASRYRSKAAAEITKINKKHPPAIPEKKPKVKEKKNLAKKKTAPPPVVLPKPAPAPSALPVSTGAMGTVTNLRFWSNPSYTRIVIDADKETRFSDRLLKKDPSIHKPQRLYVDIKQSKVGKDLDNFIPIDDNLLKNVRAGQYAPDTVRVVIDIKSFKNYKIFSLKNPFRIVVDVWGKDSGTTHASKRQPTSTTYGISNKKVEPGAIAKQFALGVRRIVIDPGHGGRDYGAPGYLKGVHERDIVLQLAKKLAKKIRADLKCEVILTREKNRYLPLEERPAIANTKNADLFISLHTNASRDKRAYGIETYFLNLATDEDAIQVAAMENATSTKNISDLHDILSSLMKNANINESSRLAAKVQDAVTNDLKKNYSRVKNKGVKQAPFYVLIGAQMPAILIETGFISNPRECKRLANSKYQDRLCDAIVHGIKNYIKETNPTAFIKHHPQSKSKG